ncbi:MAG: HAD family hydrolase [Bradymonadales bacterium]|nr:MAG: HAD family hydrolase [Bradymonadales bacterium]
MGTAFLFDLDGTLADSRQCLLNSLDHALDKIGYGDLAYDPLKATQQDLATTLRSNLAKHGIVPTETLTKEFIEYFRDFHEREGESCVELYPGVPESLEFLKGFFSLGVATTKDSPQANRVLKKLKIHHFFDHVQGTDPGMQYKPSPEILLRSLEILSREPKRSVYIGDSVHDIEAARAGGLKAVAAVYGFGGKEHFRSATPDWMLSRPDELILVKDEILKKLPGL